MASFFNFDSIFVLLLLLAYTHADCSSSLRKPQQERNLTEQVEICYKGATKKINRGRQSHFLALGATRGPCAVVACPLDAKLCGDGSYVSRDPNLNCDFPPCRHKLRKKSCCDPSTEPGKNGLPFCIEGHACCPDGRWTCGMGDAKTFVCGGKKITSGFGKTCPVAEKPSVVCPLYLILCPDGSSVGPNPEKNCAVDPCPPTCCDPAKRPTCRGEGCACCPDGSWSCSIGDGKTFSCGGKLMKSGFAKPCPV